QAPLAARDAGDEQLLARLRAVPRSRRLRDGRRGCKMEELLWPLYRYTRHEVRHNSQHPGRAATREVDDDDPSSRAEPCARGPGRRDRSRWRPIRRPDPSVRRAYDLLADRAIVLARAGRAWADRGRVVVRGERLLRRRARGNAHGRAHTLRRGTL